MEDVNGRELGARVWDARPWHLILMLLSSEIARETREFRSRDSSQRMSSFCRRSLSPRKEMLGLVPLGLHHQGSKQEETVEAAAATVA